MSSSDKELQDFVDLINAQLNFLMQEKKEAEEQLKCGKSQEKQHKELLTKDSPSSDKKSSRRLRDYTHYNAHFDRPDHSYINSITYSAADILKYLNHYVAGQSDVKKAVATTMFMHIVGAQMHSQAVREDREKDYKRSAKSQLLVAGPTGTGKTYILCKAAEFLEVPFYKIDCSNLSQAGFVGVDIREHLEAYYTKYRDHPGVNYGIILFDEIDKITLTRSASGDSNVNIHIQSSLLTLLDGSVPAITDPDKNSRICHHLNTANLQFVFAGAFSHLGRHKPKVTKGLGFGTELETVEEHAPMTHEDLEKAGMMPELIGRIGRICETHHFTDKEIWNLIDSCEDNALDHYIELFDNCSKDLKLSKKEKQALFDKVKHSKVGARILNQAVFELLEEKIFNLKFKVIYEDE